MDSITIPNIIIEYIGDSLKWIHTVWNGEKVQEGISYVSVKSLALDN
jgi:hypothetical protein